MSNHVLLAADLRIVPVGPAAEVWAVPDAAVGADHHAARVGLVPRKRAVVRVLVPAEVLPGLAAVIRPEHAARWRVQVIAELPGREDDARVRRVGLDHVV